MTSNAPLVFLVDDEESVCTALGRLIRSAGYRVESYGSARAFLDSAQVAACPACLVLDVHLPDISGLELQRRLNAMLPIIFVTGHGDFPMTVGAIKAGATDFLAKPVRDTDLLRAIGQALEQSARMHDMQHELDVLRGRVERLTPRERDVMALVVKGLLNKQVASELGTVEKTIKAHRARVMQKMEVTSLAELVRVADRIGLSGTVHEAAHH